MKIPALLAILCSISLSMTQAAESKKLQSIVLGGGCFWCTEAAYDLLPGVKDVVSGYAGGDEPNPTYEEVCAHATGHAEVIKVDFDPSEVSLAFARDFSAAIFSSSFA